MRKLEYHEIADIINVVEYSLLPAINHFFNSNLGSKWISQYNNSISNPKHKVPLVDDQATYKEVRKALGLVSSINGRNRLQTYLSATGLKLAGNIWVELNKFYHNEINTASAHRMINLVKEVGCFAHEILAKDVEKEMTDIIGEIEDWSKEVIKEAPVETPIITGKQSAVLGKSFTTNVAAGRPYNNTPMDAYINRVSEPRNDKYAIEIIDENTKPQILRGYSMGAYDYYKGKIGQVANVIRNNLIGTDSYSLANDMVANKLTDSGWSKWVSTSTAGRIRFNNTKNLRQVVYGSNGQWKIMESVEDKPFFPINDYFNSIEDAIETVENVTDEDDRLSLERLYF